MKIGDKSVKLLLDTGAGGDILDTDAVARLQLKIKEDSVGTTKGVGGAGGEFQSLEPVECQIGDEKIRIGFYPMNLSHVKSAGGDDGYDGILGSPFFRTRHAVIDFGTNTLTYDADPS